MFTHLRLKFTSKKTLFLFDWNVRLKWKVVVFGMFDVPARPWIAKYTPLAIQEQVSESWHAWSSLYPPYACNRQVRPACLKQLGTARRAWGHECKKLVVVDETVLVRVRLVQDFLHTSHFYFYTMFSIYTLFKSSFAFYF